MIIKDLIEYVFDDVHIYVKNNADIDCPFKDIYIGLIKNVPDNIICMEIASIGASSKGYLDIKVK